MYLTNKILMYTLSTEDTLLINTISGAFDIVDNETKHKVERLRSGNKESEINDSDLIGALKARGYLYNTWEDEEVAINRYRDINLKLTEKKQKSEFTICPTMGCNLRCVYCFEEDNLHKNMMIMSEGQIETILKYIDETIIENKIKQATISLFGGEPLLKGNYELVQKILEFAEERNLIVKIITNGTTIKSYEKLLVEHPTVLLQITLDGDKEIHDKRRVKADGSGSFDEICEGIEELIRLKIVTRIRINIDKENINSLGKLIDFIKEKKWMETDLIIPYVSPVLDYSDGNDNVFMESELLLKIKEVVPDLGEPKSVIKSIVSPVIGYLNAFLETGNTMKPWKMHYCEATSGENVIFSPDGNISTCLLLAGKNAGVIGTFDDKGVYYDTDLSKLWVERSVFRIPKCKQCKYGLLCGGGCPVAAIEVNGDIDCPVCSDIEKTLEVYIDTIKNKFLDQLGA
jgi:uncharacterized protein